MSRYQALVAILFCYLLPVFGLASYHLLDDARILAWQQMSAGLLISFSGSLMLFYILCRRATTQEAVLVPAGKYEEQDLAAPSVPMEQFELLSKAHVEAEATNQQLQQNLQALHLEMEKLSLEKVECGDRQGKMEAELEHCRSSANEELREQQQFIRTLQQTISEQINQLEKKSQQVGELESKVSDLTYEIKTLLHIAESHHSDPGTEGNAPATPGTMALDQSDDEREAVHLHEKQICTAEEASLQLKRCLDIAQKITGSNRFSQMSAFLESPADSFSIDLRRLCDSLRSEKGCAILFYSPREHQLLFANNQIRGLTGWSPDKFMQNFSKLLLDESAWKKAIAGLALRNEVQVQLSIKTKSGSEAQLNTHLGMIPTGIFKYHTLAVLY